MKSIDTNIEYLIKHKALLSEDQITKLLQLVSSTGDSEKLEIFEPKELDALYTLVKILQNKILTSDNELIENATARDLASLTGSIASLLRAFAAHQQKVNEAQEMADLKESVLDAIKPLPKEAQDRFFTTLEAVSS